jgi:hypothetical protein
MPPLQAASYRRKQSAMPEIINLGSLELRFLQSKDDTAGSIDVFEMTVQPNARMPIPHYHDRWDETVYGLTGTMTFRVDGKDIDLAPGKPSLSNAALCTALRIAAQCRRHAFASSARACSVRSISRTWQVFWRLRRPIRHG